VADQTQSWRTGVNKTGLPNSTGDFLGFTHHGDRTRRGYFKLGRKTAATTFRQKAKDLNDGRRRIRNAQPRTEWWKTLRAKVVGHYRYYGVSGNYRSLRQYDRLAHKLAYKWLNRRSQRKSFTYAKYQRFLQFNPLPLPRIYHSTYTLSPV